LSARQQPPASHNATFVTTHWTQVLAAGKDSNDGRQALSDLCAVCYGPVVAFLRSQGKSEDEARDLAHEFFARILEKQSLSGAKPERGRFRSYLLGALKHFLANRHALASREKRGGGATHLPLENENETGFEVGIPDATAESPEKTFDRAWALSVLERSMETLKRECEQAGRAEEFEVLKPWLTGENAPGRSAAAENLGISDGALRVATHRLRRRFREIVKAEVARTVNDPSDVAGEMQILIEALS